jgi:hypothetical protein
MFYPRRPNNASVLRDPRFQAKPTACRGLHGACKRSSLELHGQPFPSSGFVVHRNTSFDDGFGCIGRRHGSAQSQNACLARGALNHLVVQRFDEQQLGRLKRRQRHEQGGSADCESGPRCLVHGHPHHGLRVTRCSIPVETKDYDFMCPVSATSTLPASGPEPESQPCFKQGFSHRSRRFSLRGGRRSSGRRSPRPSLPSGDPSAGCSAKPVFPASESGCSIGPLGVRSRPLNPG